MKPSRIITYISIIGILFIHLMTGFLVSESGKWFVKFYDAILGGRSLPALTDWTLSFCTSGLPTILGLVIGMVFAALLWVLDKRDKGFLAPLVLLAVLFEHFFFLGTYLIAATLPAVACTTCLCR